MKIDTYSFEPQLEADLLKICMDSRIPNYVKNHFLKKIVDGQTLKSDTIIKFNPKNHRQLIVSQGPHQQEVKLGKVFRTLYQIDFQKGKHLALDGDSLENLVSLYRSFYAPITFEMWSGEDFRKAYQKKNYLPKSEAEKSSSLYASCMNDKVSYLDLYVNNPQAVKILVALNGKRQIIGRSIIWERIVNNPGVKIMSIPYVAFQFLVAKFSKFAEDNNIFLKSDLSGENYSIKLSPQSYNLTQFPYSDGITKLHPNGILSNSCQMELMEEQYPKGIIKTLSNTTGSYGRFSGYRYQLNLTGSVQRGWVKIKACDLTNAIFRKTDVISSDRFKGNRNSYFYSRNFNYFKAFDKYQCLSDIGEDLKTLNFLHSSLKQKGLVSLLILYLLGDHPQITWCYNPLGVKLGGFYGQELKDNEIRIDFLYQYDMKGKKANHYFLTLRMLNSDKKQLYQGSIYQKNKVLVTNFVSSIDKLQQVVYQIMSSEERLINLKNKQNVT